MQHCLFPLKMIMQFKDLNDLLIKKLNKRPITIQLKQAVSEYHI